MSFAVQISTKDNASTELQRLAVGITPAQINPVVGRSAVNTYKAHLTGLNSSRPNQLGGARTNFYLGAARGTQFRLEGDDVIISINQVGIRQRFYGGTIRPRAGKKFLTLPVHPDAHGKRASEFPGLMLVFGQGGKPIALARPKFRPRARGFVGPQISVAGEILFRLVRKVTQQADETVLPRNELVLARIDREATSYLNRLAARRGGAN